MDTMYFSWQESPVEIDPGVQLPQFVLEGKILYDCSQNYTAGLHSSLRNPHFITCNGIARILFWASFLPREAAMLVRSWGS